MTHLPTSVDELPGLRAARWIRESTPGQFDRYGPDAQRQLQDVAIARLGLVEEYSLEYLLAHSGATVHGSPSMLAMLDDARQGRFDVLVVGYVARWQRNLRRTLELLEDTLHPAGVAVYFADEELLSSNERHWDQLVDEAKGAESWLRKHRRRVREGLAAKLREKRDPGGRPPFGFRRNEAKLLEPDPAMRSRVRRVFELAASGLTDRDVATSSGLTIHVVRGMLRNPLYAGRLPDGRPTNFPPIIGSALWNDVHAARDRRRTRDGRPARRRPYALSMLRCAACGRRLIGDTGRYRHTDPCPRFLEAARQPKRRRRGQHRVVPGRSYRAEIYEDLVARLLERVSVGADVVAAAIAETREPEPDRVGLARIERERDQALSRYRAHRDAAELERAMVRLDTDALLARQDRGPKPLDAGEAAAYLRDLPRWWADAPNTRRELAEFLFASIDVLGLRTMRVVPTRAALERGLVDAFHARTAGYGRGERAGPHANQLIVRAVPGQATRITVVVAARPAPLVAERSA